MSFRNYVAWTIFVVLLLWGPIASWSGYLFIRLGYLVLIPLLARFLLGWIWNYLEPSNALETTLNRVLSGIICITLLIFAISEGLAKTHIDSSEWALMGDDLVPVGEYIEFNGPDWSNVIIITIFALLFLIFGVLDRGRKNSTSHK